MYLLEGSSRRLGAEIVARGVQARKVETFPAFFETSTCTSLCYASDIRP